MPPAPSKPAASPHRIASPQRPRPCRPGIWARRMLGKLFGDRGYISSDLFKALWEQKVHLVTGIRRNMKNRLMPLMDKIMLRGRSIIETINDQLKNTEQIENKI